MAEPITWREVGSVLAGFRRDGSVILKTDNYPSDFLVFRREQWDDFLADVVAGKFDRERR